MQSDLYSTRYQRKSKKKGFRRDSTRDEQVRHNNYYRDKNRGPFQGPCITITSECPYDYQTKTVPRETMF